MGTKSSPPRGSRARSRSRPSSSRERARWEPRGLRLAAALFIVFGGLAALGPASSSAYIYWGSFETQAIGRANLDGSSASGSFIGGADGPCGIALDSGHVYWGNLEGGTIGRANLDGSGANQSFISGADVPCGVAVDGSHVYWADRGANTIGRANLDGSGVQPSFITGADFPCGVAVDGGHIYWGNMYGGTIGRSNLDGSGVEQSFIQAPTPCEGSLDATHIYWIDTITGAIARANLDGSSLEANLIPGSDAEAVAVDGSHIYWIYSLTGDIARANLDGSAIDRGFITGARRPSSLAVDPYPLATATAIYCTLGPVRLLRSERCTVTVTGSGAGAGAPSGEVGVGSGASGSFAPAVSCALVASGPELSSCQVSSAVAGAQFEVIGAAYSGDATHAPSTGTTSSTEPPNHFGLSRVRFDRRRGSASIFIAVPGAGRVVLAGRSIRGQAKSLAGAGRLRFSVRPTGRATSRLKRIGVLRLTADLTYTPAGGLPATKERKLVLRRGPTPTGPRRPRHSASSAQPVLSRSMKETP